MYIMVLNDGETFTNLEGCSVIRVNREADIEEVEEALDNFEDQDLLEVVATFGGK